jgi:hypothetical protein
MSPVSANEVETISPKTPSAVTVPADPMASISGVLTDEPAAAVEAPNRNSAPAASGMTTDGPNPANGVEEAEIETAPTTNSPLDVNASSRQNEFADMDIPHSVTSEPVPIPTSSPPTITQKANEGHTAQSIDEAIADFQSAIKTPEPESLKASEALSATEKDETLTSTATRPEPAETSAPGLNGVEKHATTRGSAAADQATTGNIEEKVSVGEKGEEKPEISATAPRRVIKTPVPPAKDESPPRHSEEGEGTTMEDIEID